MPDIAMIKMPGRQPARATHYRAVFDKATGAALDLFRARRTTSPAQRLMLIARDGGCTVPAYGSQVHHAARDWANGHTNTNELGLACGPDNRMVAPGGWSTRTNNYHRPERRHPPPNDEPIADTPATHAGNPSRAGPDEPQNLEPDAA
jgi:hypothetical protein